MAQYSDAERKIIDSLRLSALSASLKTLGEKASELENSINSGVSFATIQAQINSIVTRIHELESYGKLVGGNITISSTEPESPSENDIWFDLGLIHSI